MKLHRPTLIKAIESRLPGNITLTHSGTTIYLFTAFPVRRDWLTGIICDALLAACETPQETPCETPCETLLETHSLTLLRTLCETQTFQKTLRKMGESGASYEIRIDEQELTRIVIAARLEADCLLVMQISDEECYMSIRKAQKKLAVMTGKWFSTKRLSEALAELERVGKFTSGKRLRTFGREVK